MSRPFTGQLPGGGKCNAAECPRVNLQDNSQVGAQRSRVVRVAVRATTDTTSRETSRKVTYLFRKGRPTIAMREREECAYWLCALCLHPIGYYGDTWAGVMCPTDEVIAHLLMMRGSEEKFWANANQHPIDHPAAGV